MAMSSASPVACSRTEPVGGPCCVGAPPSSIRSRAFRSSRLSGLARRLRKERAYQRAQRSTAALRACHLGLVVLPDREGDVHFTSTGITVVLVHRHGRSSLNLQSPLTISPNDSGPEGTAGVFPRLDAAHHSDHPQRTYPGHARRRAPLGVSSPPRGQFDSTLSVDGGLST